MCAKREVPSGRGPGPALGPWKLRGSRCSLVQSELYFGSNLSNKFISFNMKTHIHTTWAGKNQTQAGEREILENSPQSGRVGLSDIIYFCIIYGKIDILYLSLLYITPVIVHCNFIPEVKTNKTKTELTKFLPSSHNIKPRPEAHMDMILFEVILKSIDLIPQQQILQWHCLYYR